ncbi:iron complex transport system substrate-binding protein [Glaciihabitans tibetensis]|uniref:Iron complex transport system substrate-binding protein n=1 Tax=Glaciihabitans tibetensis TaxID=1266600 RepID=A0A2T0VFN6_9MICO|nr:iron-siderophore ABC transporter substrate-binding protein [Glaciihabitans tibetensis]PRY69011.1 iron complex transport system substrate-binding protein [Glaciihabitans tibetensis]
MSRRPLYAFAAAATALALTLSGCASSTPEDAPEAAASASFPVTIEHAFGETTIDDQPERVVTLGWGSTDAAIAVGIVPVAIPFDGYAGDENGVLPWVAEALDEMGEEIPVVLPAGDEPAYEDIAAAEPDVILATYSGITEEQYDLLSEIAPVVAYPGEAWATPWRELIETTGTALGKSDEATQVLEDIDTSVAEAAAAHPEFEGKSIALTSDTAGVFYVYKKEDPRVEFTLDLGFVNAPAVDELANGDSTFFYMLSYEELDKLESDVAVNFAATQEEADGFLSASYSQVMPQVQNGTVASVVGPAFVASVSPPTALSLPWGLDDYVALLSEAALAADAAN